MANTAEVRIFHSLRRSGLRTIDNLRETIQADELKNFRNIGAKSIPIILEALAKHDQKQAGHNGS